MAAHVFLRTTAPSTAPTEVGNHWVDTVNKVEYFSVGTASVADWVLGAGSTAVTSIFGRTGVVVAQTGDYDTTQITEAGDKFFISAADLALIGSSAQPGDNISIFVNDAGYITAAGAPVQSVNGQTGTVVLDADDIDDSATTNKFATQAQLDQITTNQTNIALKYDTSNPANYIDAAGAPVQSVNSQTGTVVLDADNIDDTATTNKFATQAELDLIASSAQPGDNISIFTNDAGYITSAGAPVQSVNGQTGVVVLDANDIGLGNVDNTSDANKPVSTAQQAALDLKYNASNPNGYETPAQLDARDVADRNRANHTGTQLASTISDFTEAAQDAVGTSLVDSASVDFTYDDVANTITADVLPAGVNHDALQNYVANEHIDHSTVSIDAGTGLTGGGDITATRTISMPNVGTAGSYGSATDVPVITTDTQGRVSAATNTPIQIAQSQVTDLITDLINKANLSNGNTFTGDQVINGAFEVNSTTEGFLPPRMTTVERDAIVSSVNGLVVYNTTTNKLQVYENGAWVDYVTTLDPNIESYFFDDFNIGVANGLGWTITVSGSGASGQGGTYGINSTEKAVGVLQLDTGTTATGRASYNRSVNQMRLGYYSIDQTWRAALEQLSTPTQRFIIYIGFIDNTGAGAPIDGCYFAYADSLGPNWLCISRSNNVQTTTDSGVVVDTVYNVFRTVINADATSVDFFINNTLITTHTTNIPNGVGRETGIGVKIQKVIGITQVNAALDYYEHKIKIPGGRD